MSPWIVVAVLTLIAGLAIPAGALVALFEHIRPQWLEEEFRHTVLALGGGALLAAVALVLVPEGSEALSPWLSVFWFLAGGVVFSVLDYLLAQHHSPVTNLTAMLSDFLPEAMALGAAFANGGRSATLLALLIALQNFPEGFNAYREIRAGAKLSGKKILTAFTALALLGPLAGLSGYFLLAHAPATVAAIKLIAGGGILVLVFQDVAPQAKLERAWAPPLGAVLGFSLGLLGQELL